MAISLAGISTEGGLIVTSAEEHWMQQLGIRRIADVRSRNVDWLWQHYSKHFHRKRVIGFQDPKKAQCLADYSIFAGTITIYTPGPTKTSPAIYSDIVKSLTPNNALLGWGTSEFDLVSWTAERATFVNAADWAEDLSALTNIRLAAPFHQRTHSPSPPSVPNTHTVCFVFTDGDNIQWMLNQFATSHNWYGSPHRGQTKIGWTVSPALSELAPSILAYLYANATKTAKGNDYFIAAASGIGYTYPDYFEASKRSEYASLTNSFMHKADLNILNVIGNSMTSQYLQPLISQSSVNAIFYYDFSSYDGENGKMIWIDGKPVISARFRLWVDVNTPTQLAAKLNAQPVNIRDSSAYSLVSVHAWSMTPQSVVECVSHLERHVRVVAPDEFVDLIKKHVR